MIASIGARSGLLRLTPLLCFHDAHNPEKLAVIASNWGKHRHPSWYHNLRKNPHVKGTVDGNARDYIAHEIIGEEYQHYWSIATQAYVGYLAYRQRARWHIPIMLLVPEEGG